MQAFKIESKNILKDKGSYFIKNQRFMVIRPSYLKSIGTLHFEAVGPRSTMFVKVRFCFKSESARHARIRSFICMCPNVLLQNAGFGTGEFAIRTCIG